MDEPTAGLGPEALQHLDALYCLARWLTRDPAEAEDLVQETYLRAIRSAHQFQPGTNLRAWLFQILRNRFLTTRARRSREPEPMEPERLEGLGQTGESGGADPSPRLDLATALSRLPEEFRTAVLLADLEEFEMGEIARIMDCPVGTVKSRLFRGRAMLRALLADYRE